MSLAMWRDLSLILIVLEVLLFVVPVAILLYFAVRSMPVIPQKLLPILEQVRAYVLRAERETKRAAQLIIVIPITVACALAQIKHTARKLMPE